MRLHKDGEQFEQAAGRSLRREVRNPIFGLRAMEKIRALPPEARQALAELLAEMRIEASEKADQSWASRKAPMAAYWRAVSVYCGHIRRAVLKPFEFFMDPQVRA